MMSCVAVSREIFLHTCREVIKTWTDQHGRVNQPCHEPRCNDEY